MIWMYFLYIKIVNLLNAVAQVLLRYFLRTFDCVLSDFERCVIIQ